MAANAPTGLETPKSGTLAILLTWFLPGAGHIYLGRIAFGFGALVVVSGLYALGLRLSEGMTFEFLDAELRSPFATALTPEVGNLSALIYQMKHYGFGPPQPRELAEWVRLGSYLSALSGLANACLAAHAASVARESSAALVATRPKLAPALQTFAAWAVPGLGHWLQGRKLRALIVGALLIGLFVTGSLLAEYSNLSRSRHFYYWGGQFLVGLPAAALEAVKGGVRVDHEIVWADTGLLFGCIAGLLNVLAMLDVYAWGEALAFGDNPLAPRGEAAKAKAARSKSKSTPVVSDASGSRIAPVGASGADGATAGSGGAAGDSNPGAGGARG